MPTVRSKAFSVILFSFLSVSAMIIWYSGYLEGEGDLAEYRQWYNHQAHWGDPSSLDDVLRSAQKDTSEKSAQEKCDIKNLPPIDSDDQSPCSRSTLVRRINSVLDSDIGPYFSGSGDVQEKGRASLTRLRDCIQDPSDCRPETFKVLVTTYSWFIKSYFWKGEGVPTGEVIWTQSLVEALDRAGFTVIVTPYYQGMVRLYRELGDLVTMVWLQDIDTITCQLDPYCVADMTPTVERYPELEQSLRDDDFPVWESVHTEKDNSKWFWTREELDAIPVAERGKIPLHKLFTPTVWGEKPGDGGLAIPDDGNYHFNPLGPEWTISPFRYPGHTWLPFSLEAKCQAIEEQEKEDSIFVLGKRTYFFYEKLAPDYRLWPSISKDTGMKIVSAAVPDKERNNPLPEGVHHVGPFNPITFNEQLGKSRIMLAIGNPNISPSPFDAVCQGTPVLIPTYHEFPHDFLWDAFTTYSQNYPVLQLGEPYAYGYKKGNHTDLMITLNRALSNPIPRYIPPELTMRDLENRLRWYFDFDWQTIAQHRWEERLARGIPLDELKVAARCYELGHCTAYLDRQ